MTTEKTAQEIWDELEAEEESGAQAPEEHKAEPEQSEQAHAEESDGEQPEGQAQATPASSSTSAPQAPLSEEHVALLKQIPELTHLVKTTIGRVGSLQSELQRIGHAAAKSAGDSPSAGQINAASSDPKSWAKLKEDFPDWAEGVEAFVSSRIPSAPPKVDLGAELTPHVERIRQELAVETVAAFEPDWESTVTSQAFKKWFRSQPADYQKRAGESWRPQEVLATIRDFRSASQPQDAAPAKRNLAAASIPKSVSKPNIRKPVDEMSPQEYWRYLDEQESKSQRAF